MTQFKVFSGKPLEVEDQANRWARAQPAEGRVVSLDLVARPQGAITLIIAWLLPEKAGAARP